MTVTRRLAVIGACLLVPVLLALASQALASRPGPPHVPDGGTLNLRLQTNAPSSTAAPTPPNTSTSPGKRPSPSETSGSTEATSKPKPAPTSKRSVDRQPPPVHTQQVQPSTGDDDDGDDNGGDDGDDDSGDDD